MFIIFGGLSEDSSPGGSLSNSSEGLLLRDKGGARIYRSFVIKTRLEEHQKITNEKKKKVTNDKC